jgi:hypothetical protein
MKAELKVMSHGFRVTLLLAFGALSTLLISPGPAGAQSQAPSSEGDRTWAVLDIANALNSALEADNGGELREKVVRRFSECSLMYGGLSTLTANAEAKKSYVRAQEATMVIESAIAKPLQSQRRLELEQAAQKSVALMLRTVKAQGDKEVAPLLKSCKALNDVGEIKNALQALPPL